MSGILNRPNSSSNESDMSYADMAASGPKQSAQEKMPHAVPELDHDDSGVRSLDSLSSGVHSIDSLDSSSSNQGTSSNNSIPSYADQQLAHERAEKAGEDAEAAADQIAQEAKEFTRKAEEDLAALEASGEKKAKEVENKTQKKAEEVENKAEKKAGEVEQKAKENYGKAREQAGETYENVKKEAKASGKKVQQGAKQVDDWAGKNKGNPVVVGNAVVMGAVAGLLGIGAYRMHQQGTLTWKVAGAWAGVVGLFGLGDYYVSQWLFQNRYPTK